MTSPVSEVQVDPVKVIAILKQRLAQEIGQTAMLEAMVQEGQLREHALNQTLALMRAEAGGDAGPPEEGLRGTITKLNGKVVK
jgi:hypothetical protein